MELELGLKISKTVDDCASSANLLIAKDRAGPLFLCRETESKFILTAHLTGYKRKFVKIEINEDGSRIAVSGEKPVQEMVMEGWKVQKKEIEMKGFRRDFKIPEGVILDRIKARFNEDESILTISMPKLEKGVCGVRVEEVREEEEEASGGSSQSWRKEHGKPGTEGVEESDRAVEKLPDSAEKVEESCDLKEQRTKRKNEGLGQIETTSLPNQLGQLEVERKEEIQKRGNGIEKKTEREDDDNDEEKEERGHQATEREKWSKLRAPTIAASALIVSIMVLVIHWIRTKIPEIKRKN